VPLPDFSRIDEQHESIEQTIDIVEEKGFAAAQTSTRNWKRPREKLESRGRTGSYNRGTGEVESAWLQTLP
jgi:hypothetical protein